MPSLGDLYVELGVVGNTSKLEKTLEQMKEAARLTERQIQLDNLRQAALKKVQEAATLSAKKDIVRNYNNQKKLLAQNNEIAGTEKLISKNKSLVNAMGAVVKGLFAVGAAMTGAYIAIDRLTQGLIKQNQEWLNITRTSDLALSQLQGWDGVGKAMGIDNVAGSIQNLNDRLFDLKLTGEGARGFQLAGVNPVGTDAFGVLDQIRERIKGMDNTAASYLLKQMGLDPQMLALLRMERKEFEELYKVQQKYSLNYEQRKAIEQYNVQLTIAQKKMQYFKDRAILAVMPYWVEFMKSVARITEMFIKFLPFLKRVGQAFLTLGLFAGKTGVKFNKLTRAFAKMTAPLHKILKPFTILGKLFPKLISMVPRFGKALGLLGGIFKKAFLPLTAAYLLLDDLATYFEGGDSLTGRVLDWLKDTGGELSEGFGKIFSGDFSGFGDIGNTLLDAINQLTAVISRLGDIILNFLSFGAWNKVKKGIDWLMPSPEKVLKDIKEGQEGKSTGGAAGISAGYSGELPDLNHVSPDVQNTTLNNQKISNLATNNDNRVNTVNQTIAINTNQPAEAIKNSLTGANYVFAH